MRALADENVPRSVVQLLRAQSHDVVWVRTDLPGVKDRDLLELAETDGLVVLTLDKDFWQLALQRRQPLRRCGVILFRVTPAVPENLKPLISSALRIEQSRIGYFSIVTKHGIEMIATGKL